MLKESNSLHCLSFWCLASSGSASELEELMSSMSMPNRSAMMLSLALNFADDLWELFFFCFLPLAFSAAFLAASHSWVNFSFSFSACLMATVWLSWSFLIFLLSFLSTLNCSVSDTCDGDSNDDPVLGYLHWKDGLREGDFKLVITVLQKMLDRILEKWNTGNPLGECMIGVMKTPLQLTRPKNVFPTHLGK